MNRCRYNRGRLCVCVCVYVYVCVCVCVHECTYIDYQGYSVPTVAAVTFVVMLSCFVLRTFHTTLNIERIKKSKIKLSLFAP